MILRVLRLLRWPGLCFGTCAPMWRGLTLLPIVACVEVPANDDFEPTKVTA